MHLVGSCYRDRFGTYCVAYVLRAILLEYGPRVGEITLVWSK